MEYSIDSAVREIIEGTRPRHHNALPPFEKGRLTTEDQRRAVVVLEESIDLCRERGYHMRSTLWLVEEGSESRILFSDNAYECARGSRITMNELLNDGVTAEICDRSKSLDLRNGAYMPESVKIYFDGKVEATN